VAAGSTDVRMRIRVPFETMPGQTSCRHPGSILTAARGDPVVSAAGLAADAGVGR
jgi:hypothetical protein